MLRSVKMLFVRLNAEADEVGFKFVGGEEKAVAVDPRSLADGVYDVQLAMLKDVPSYAISMASNTIDFRNAQLVKQDGRIYLRKLQNAAGKRQPGSGPQIRTRLNQAIGAQVLRRQIGRASCRERV